MSGLFKSSFNLLPFVEVFFAAALTTVLLALTLRLKKHRKADCREEPGAKVAYGLEAIPSVKPMFPIVGNFVQVLPLKDSWKKGLKWCEKYGDIFKFVGLGETHVVFNSAELAQTLLKCGDFGHVTKSHSVYRLFKPFLTNGVLVSNGHFWHGQRKILLKSQSFSTLKACMGMLNKYGKNFVEDVRELYKDEQPKAVNFLINRTFLCMISEMITGYDSEDNVEMDRYHQNTEIWKEMATNRIIQPWLLLDPIWMWSSLKKKQDKAVEEMCEFSRRRIHKHKLDRQQCSSVNEKGGGSNDESSSFRSVLDELLDAGVDDEQILEEMNTMLFAGHETVAGAIHSFCFLIALNPEFQGKCRQEIDALLGDNGEMILTFDDVQSGLKYLERCILETLRLVPPAFFFSRELQSPLNIVHKGKHIVLPPGTNAVVQPFTLHRKPEYYPDPEIFNPDRFLPEEIAKRSMYAYLPFSGGPRGCLGSRFAMQEMKVIAAYMLRNFEITTKDKMEDIALLPYITTTPERDYVFNFTKRS